LAEAPEELVRAIGNNFGATGAVLEGLAKMQLGRTEEGQALFEKALEAEPGHLVAREMLSAILLNRGLEATDAGRLEEAEVVLKRTVFLNPTVQAHRALGNVYYKEELWEKAAFEYRGALDKEPFSAAAHKSLGYALIGLGGREQEALHHLNLALELEPDDPEAEDLRSLIERLADSIAAPSK
jgi:tetratricopeptide (TPR) repeat protein